MAGLDPAIHLLETTCGLRGCQGQARAWRGRIPLGCRNCIPPL